MFLHSIRAFLFQNTVLDLSLAVRPKKKKKKKRILFVFAYPRPSAFSRTIQLNPHVNAFQRNFVNEVKRADEMDRKLRFFQTQIDNANKPENVGSQGPIAVAAVSNDGRDRELSMDELEVRNEMNAIGRQNSSHLFLLFFLDSL